MRTSFHKALYPTSKVVSFSTVLRVGHGADNIGVDEGQDSSNPLQSIEQITALDGVCACDLQCSDCRVGCPCTSHHQSSACKTSSLCCTADQASGRRSSEDDKRDEDEGDEPDNAASGEESDEDIALQLSGIIEVRGVLGIDVEGLCEVFARAAGSGHAPVLVLAADNTHAFVRTVSQRTKKVPFCE